MPMPVSRGTDGAVDPAKCAAAEVDAVEPAAAVGPVDPAAAIGAVITAAAVGEVDPAAAVGAVNPAATVGAVDPAAAVGATDTAAAVFAVVPAAAGGEVDDTATEAADNEDADMIPVVDDLYSVDSDFDDDVSTAQLQNRLEVNVVPVPEAPETEAHATAVAKAASRAMKQEPVQDTAGAVAELAPLEAPPAQQESEQQPQSPKFDLDDPLWRSSPAGRAAYAKFGRDKKKDGCPEEVVNEFDRVGGKKGDLFKLWVKHAGDWLEVCYSSGLRVRTNDSAESMYKLWTRKDIENKFGEGLVDWIVDQKTQKQEYVNNPDFPEKEELRMYYMFDTTVWSHKSENIDEKHMKGNTSLTGEEAVKMGEQMRSAALPGPTTFAKAPCLIPFLVGGPGAAAGAGGSEGSAVTVGAGTKTPRQPKAQPKKISTKKTDGMMEYFKCMTKVIDEVDMLKGLIVKCRAHSSPVEIEPFVKLLEGSQAEIVTAYEKLRAEAQKSLPELPDNDCRR